MDTSMGKLSAILHLYRAKSIQLSTLFLLVKLSIISHFVCQTILHYELHITIQTFKLVVIFLAFS